MKQALLCYNVFDYAGNGILRSTWESDRRPYTRKFGNYNGRYLLLFSDQGLPGVGEDIPVDTLAIMGQTFASAGAVIELKYSTDNVTYSDAFTPYIPAADGNEIKTFPAVDARYWQLYITAYGEAYYSLLMAGGRVEFPRNIKGPYESIPIKRELVKSVNLNGRVVNTETKGQLVAVSVKAEYLTDTWIRNTWEPAYNNHLRKGEPFIWMWDTTRASDALIVQLQTCNTPYVGSRRHLSFTARGMYGI